MCAEPSTGRRVDCRHHSTTDREGFEKARYSTRCEADPAGVLLYTVRRPTATAPSLSRMGWRGAGQKRREGKPTKMRDPMTLDGVAAWCRTSRMQPVDVEDSTGSSFFRSGKRLGASTATVDADWILAFAAISTNSRIRRGSATAPRARTRQNAGVRRSSF